ncbi:peptide chain release factor H [Aliikangiella sp. IMCC44359]|uniref:peptide chain release factor H n=1 Tax=Aliikangiella sp. IMCC44359 TaxID=3459125 RepID=UPI00403B249C
MILLQLSAAQGPEECRLAVSLMLKVFIQEAEAFDVTFSIIEQEPVDKTDRLKSVLLKLEGDKALTLSKNWMGTIQWICQSPFRPKHKRKNWFVVGTIWQQDKFLVNSEIQFETCRSSGPGGQHVNKTNSAVRAKHLSSGISVKVQSERSQHANKKLAKILIEYKLSELMKKNQQSINSARHKSHYDIERGNAVRVFKGLDVIEITQ